MRSALCCVAVVAAFGQSGVGGIQGKISDDLGQPLASVYVMAAPMGPGGRQTLTTMTAASGAYSFDQASPGTYQMCVQSPGSAYLDPCRWSAPLQVKVTA